jgi:hypothetical protein
MKPANDRQWQTQSDNVQKNIKNCKGHGLPAKIHIEMATKSPKLVNGPGREDLDLKSRE